MERKRSADNDGSIDYHVTFPPPSSVSDPCIDVADDSQPSSKKREPVVILLGWAGCIDRHLVKYSAIYDKRCVTIRYTAPTDDIFFRTDNLKRSAEKLLELLVELDLDSNPVFVHSFSNGGCSVHRWISHLVQRSPKFRHVRLSGAVFDSCPGRRGSALRSAKVYAMITKHPAIVKYVLALFIFVYFAVRRLVNSILGAFRTGSSDSSELWTALENDPNRCPQLYLYSRADELISFRHVEDQIEARKRTGIKVFSRCWDDSVHVAHLMTHRESYIKSCHDFVDYCCCARDGF